MSIGAQYNQKRLFLEPSPLDCKSKSGESTKWVQWLEAVVVGGGSCITLGSLDQSEADGDDDIDLFSVPHPPPSHDAVRPLLPARPSWGG